MVQYPASINFYKLVCEVDGRVYVGQTCRTLKARMGSHRRDKAAAFSKTFNEIGHEKFTIHLLETRVCETIMEARRKEVEWMDHFGSCDPSKGFNIARVMDSSKEGMFHYQQQYRHTHRDEIVEKKRKYREENNEDIAAKKKAYRHANMDVERQYREDHKDHINARKRELYKAEKERDPEGLAAKKRAAYDRRKAKAIEN